MPIVHKIIFIFITTFVKTKPIIPAVNANIIVIKLLRNAIKFDI